MEHKGANGVCVCAYDQNTVYYVWKHQDEPIILYKYMLKRGRTLKNLGTDKIVYLLIVLFAGYMHLPVVM